MTIATYADLQSAISDWLVSPPAAVTARIPDFVMLFETTANTRLRLRLQESTSTLTPSSGVATLPSDYLAWRRVTWTGSSPRELEYVHPSYLHALFPTLDAGDPRYFTIEGSNLTVAPTDSTTLTFDYFQKIPALASNSTNWLLTAYPNAYLFGALTEAYAFRKDVDNMTLWGQRRDAVFDEIQNLDVKTRGPSAVRVMGPTP